MAPSHPNLLPPPRCYRGVVHPSLSYLTSRIISIVSITDSLSQYYSSLGFCAPNNGPCAWLPATNTTTYQSLVTLGAALINLILASIVLIAYFWGAGEADKWEEMRGQFEKYCSALKIMVASAATGAMYSTSSSSGATQSLMGQSCNTATQLNTLFFQIVNFSSLCAQQVKILKADIANCRTLQPG